MKGKQNMEKVAASAARSAMMLVEMYKAFSKAFSALQKHMHGGQKACADTIVDFITALLFIEMTAGKIIDEAASIEEGTAKLIAKIREEMKNTEAEDGNWE